MRPRRRRRSAPPRQRGLSSRTAGERLAREGANVLEQPPQRSRLEVLLEQFRSLPVGLLAGAAVLSVATGGLLEAAAILAVVGLNGAIGYGVERRSERTISGLGTAADQTAWVVRDGTPAEVGLDAVVPGDLLTLRRGTLVPADARIVSARDLTVSEAMLTGESLPVTKTAETLPPGAVPLGDRTNMVYRGTVVTGGSGTAIAVATGARTEVGRIQRLLGETATPETPMQRQLDTMGRQLVWFSLGVCGLVFGIGVLRGFAALQMVRSAILLAVSAVPEGLPVIATTTLAFGVEKMRRRDVLVRRLDAVETLASVRVVCFDKTGTLTVNRMSVAAVALGRCERIMRLDVLGAPLAAGDQAPAPPMEEELARLLRIGILCSETQIEAGPDGRPALSGTAHRERARAAGARPGNGCGSAAAGMPEADHPLQDRGLPLHGHHPSAGRNGGDAGRGQGQSGGGARALRLAAGGRPAASLDPGRPHGGRAGECGDGRGSVRVLGFACKQIGEAEADEEAAAVTGLTWLGLAGMADPVRPGSAELMRTLHGAGIHTLIMTGDQVPTARAVARQLGLNGRRRIEVLDAAEVDAMPSERLAQAAQRVHVLARVSPAQKLAVVRALQGAGVVVGMIGDGINDSPALKAADVGIAMGREGTDAAREVADVVLQTDDLAALSLAVAHGRTTRANVRRSVRYLLGSNFSELAVVLAATAAGFGEPLSGPQLLWINLVTDVLPGLGLALEPPAPDAMLRPPDAAEEADLGGRDWAGSAREGGVIAAGGLLACGWGVLRHGASAQARTMTFGGLVTAQLLHALACRPDGALALKAAGAAAQPRVGRRAGGLGRDPGRRIPRAGPARLPRGRADRAARRRRHARRRAVAECREPGAGAAASLARARRRWGSESRGAFGASRPGHTGSQSRPGRHGPGHAERLATDRTRGGQPGRHSEGEDAMGRETGIQVHSYRGHRIEVRDDGGDGWAVTVHPRPGDHGAPETLRSGMLNGLAGLLAEARRRVDRRLDAGPGEVRA